MSRAQKNNQEGKGTFKEVLNEIKFLEPVVSDIHSGMNTVWHQEVIQIDSVLKIQETVRRAKKQGLAIAICGGRHAMGGQQFAHAGVLLNMRSFDRVLRFDSIQGTIKVQAGIIWSDLIERLGDLQIDAPRKERWSIIQKPTGADNLSIGGCLSSNIHGRGLTLKPFVDDIEEFELINHEGELITVSRGKNTELFRIAVGGYGLFGIIVSVTLKLRKTSLMRRYVKKVKISDLMNQFNELIEDGHEYGDCQFAIDNDAEDFLRTGILASYKKVADYPETTEQENFSGENEKKVLSLEQWKELLCLAHCDKSGAFDKYLNHYLETDGQLYFSDTMQLSVYMDDYHEDLDRLLDTPKASEIITELYVPRDRLVDLMESVRDLFIKEKVDLIYGTIRLIRKDEETYLAWAKRDYVCVIFNLHTEHGSDGITRGANVFRKLIKIAGALQGSFYLTYHRYADKIDLDQCYPQFKDFLELKLKYDPEELFQSQWYRHYRDLYKRA